MKTFLEIRTFNGTTYLKRNPINAQTKLGYAITKIGQGQVASIVKDYQKAYQESWYENVGKKQIDLALTDKVTGAILSAPKDSEREYLYDKEGIKGVIEAEKAFAEIGEGLLKEWDAKEFEIVPHYAAEIPADITAEDLEIMKGFTIDPSYELPVIEATVVETTVE